METSSIITTIVSGGVTGIIGNIISTLLTARAKSKEFEKKYKLKSLILDILELYKDSPELKDVDLKALQDLVEDSNYVDETLLDSVDELKDLARTKFNTVLKYILFIAIIASNTFKTFVRPVSTAVFEIYMFVVWLKLYTMIETLPNSPSPAMIQSLFKDVTLTILYVAVTCVTWWFGATRTNKSTSPGKNVS